MLDPVDAKLLESALVTRIASPATSTSPMTRRPRCARVDPPALRGRCHQPDQGATRSDVEPASGEWRAGGCWTTSDQCADMAASAFYDTVLAPFGHDAGHGLRGGHGLRHRREADFWIGAFNSGDGFRESPLASRRLMGGRAGPSSTPGRRRRRGAAPSGSGPDPPELLRHVGCRTPTATTSRPSATAPTRVANGRLRRSSPGQQAATQGVVRAGPAGWSVVELEVRQLQPLAAHGAVRDGRGHLSAGSMDHLSRARRHRRPASGRPTPGAGGSAQASRLTLRRYSNRPGAVRLPLHHALLDERARRSVSTLVEMPRSVRMSSNRPMRKMSRSTSRRPRLAQHVDERAIQQFIPPSVRCTRERLRLPC